MCFGLSDPTSSARIQADEQRQKRLSEAGEDAVHHFRDVCQLLDAVYSASGIYTYVDVKTDFS